MSSKRLPENVKTQGYPTVSVSAGSQLACACEQESFKIRGKRLPAAVLEQAQSVSDWISANVGQ